MSGIIKCPKCERNMMVSKHVNEDNTQDVSCLNCGFRTKKQVLGGTTVKPKIDLEKFICSLMKRFYETHNIDPITTECWLDKVLKDQGLEYKDGEIVEIPQESEDEMTKKDIIQFVKSRLAGFPECEMFVNWLKKQGEQKSVDKIEPKFKVGDWIKHNKANFIFQINKVTANKYEFNNPDGYNHSLSIKSVDKKYHLWTIQDAKDGDVLVASDGSIFLFKCMINCACKHYVAFTTDNVVELNEGLEHYWESSKVARPATKEQRDFLFQEIRKSGYEWDAEKKELRKMKQKPKWSNDDKQYLLVCKNALRKYQVSDKWDADIIIKWLEDKLKQGEQKPKWTEEDEKVSNGIMAIVEDWYNSQSQEEKEYYGDCGYISWLKSLKQKLEAK